MHTQVLAAALLGLFAAPALAGAPDAPVRDAEAPKAGASKAGPLARSETVEPAPAGARRWAPLLAGAGAVVAITGTFLLLEGNRVEAPITPEKICGGPCSFILGSTSPSAEAMAAATRLRFAGASLVGVGAAALVSAGVLFLTGDSEPRVQAGAVAVNGNYLVTVSGKLP